MPHPLVADLMPHGATNLRRVLANPRCLTALNAAELKALDELQNRFFANITHELRTPLTLIVSPVDKLLETPDLPVLYQQQLSTLYFARFLGTHSILFIGLVQILYHVLS